MLAERTASRNVLVFFSFFMLGFRVWGLRLRVKGSGLGFSDLGFKVQGLGFTV